MRSEAGAGLEGRGAADEWLTPARFALVLGALIFAAFPEVLLGIETFVVRDFGLFAYPLAHYQRTCFWRGELPLWNPYNNCGLPFLAQWNTMPLYPPALVYLGLPLSRALGLFCLLHLFFAGLGMYFLARRWTGNCLGASVAGLAFAFNGLTLNLLMWPSHIATLSWMPWVLLCVEQAWRLGGRSLVLAALAGALQMLAGGPETILLTWLLLVALWTVDHAPKAGLGQEAVSRWRTGFRCVSVVLLVAGLAAAQLLPFLDLTAHSQREQGYADLRWSMPGWGWANFLVPMVFGDTWNQQLFYQYWQSWTSSYYLGMGVLLLALLAVATVRERRVRWLAAGAATALILAFGDQTFVYPWLRRLMPALSLMTYPVKFVTVIAFAVPLLAGFALARWRESPAGKAREPEKKLILFGGVLLALIAAILVWAWRWPFPRDNVPATLINGAARAGFLALAMVVLLTLRRKARPEWQRMLFLVLLFVCWLDVWTHEPSQNPTVPPRVYAAGLARARLAMNPEPALGQSRAMVSPAAEAKLNWFVLREPEDNLLAKRLGYFSDCNVLDEVPKVNGFFSLYPRECAALGARLYASADTNFLHLADFMSVSQLTAPGEILKWLPRGSFLPLATAGQTPVFLDDPGALNALFRPDFDGRKTVFLPPEVRAQVSVTRATDARVLAQRFESQRVVLEVEAAAPSLVVVAQTYYHWWRAEVDGRPTPVWRANYAFQALEVPAGRHQVRLSYQDRLFQAGGFLSCLSLAGCLAIWLRSRPLPPVRRPIGENGLSPAPGGCIVL